MKKKLIAIVASLAMVATMVPASAFADAAVDDVTISNMDSITIKAPNAYQLNWEADEFNGVYKGATEGWNINEGLTGKATDSKLTLSGVVPYSTQFAPKGMGEKNEPQGGANYQGIYDPAEQNGHFIRVRVDAEKTHSKVAGWALAWTSEEKTTKADKTVKTGNIEKLKVYRFKDKSTDGSTILMPVQKGKDIAFTAYYLTAKGIEELAKYSWDTSRRDTDNFEVLFGDPYLTGARTDLTKSAIYTEDTPGTTSTLTDETAYNSFDSKKLTSLDATITRVKADTVKGIAGTKNLTVDTSALTFLDKDQTDAISGFVKSVTDTTSGIASVALNKGQDGTDPTHKVIDKGDVVTTAYKQKTTAAKSIYDTLDVTAKTVVDNAAEDTIIYEAAEGLKQAEKNIASFEQISAVAALIKALPAPDKLDLNDAKAVEQVKDAVAAVNKLTQGAQDALLAGDDYLTKTEQDTYTKDKELVENATVNAVVEAIKALPALPKEFADQAGVDAINSKLAEAEKAYDELSDDDQKKVTNANVLKDYRTAYDKLLKAYVDDIYAEAEKIDVTQPLTVENVALVTELKTYVEGGYIKTKYVDGFKQATYDALIAALGNEYDLAEATVTVNDTENIVYDGSKKTPAVTVTDKAGKEIAADNYAVVYSDNKDAGTATITVVAKGSTYTGMKEATFTIKPADLTTDMVQVANTTYTGKAVKPAVSVASGVDYTVAYKNNTAVGKASAVVTGTGNYTGTITKNFIVKPAKESITSLKAGKKQITVAYKAQTGAKYRVICKASGLKAIGTNTTATKKTVKKLKSGKTCQVKVRAYKAVDGKTYYGTYSAVKKVKVK
ncbi:MAG: hypothetical protein HFE76_16670 [Firmicutes bacterium]|nr:hypothetical protein [Bacillota bacterium]